MKTCPICHAVAFDDAAVCFGCLYRFEEESEGGERASQNLVQENIDEPEERDDGRMASDAGKCDFVGDALQPRDAQQIETQASPPAFFIKMVPVMQDSGAVSWTCSVGVEEV